MARRDDDIYSGGRVAVAATAGIVTGAAVTYAATRYVEGKANTVSVDGRPVILRKVDSKRIATNAKEFQFKSGGDAGGVTERLKGITKWDPTSAGTVAVYETRAGKIEIADGHQRLGLANRLTEGKAKGIPLNAQVYREADGWTRQQVRTQAALINIRQNSGKPIDIAEVLRSEPRLIDGSIPKNSARMRQALGLADLSPAAFGMVKSGMADPMHAAAIGSAVTDKALHASLLADMAKAGIKTQQEARLFVSQAVAAPTLASATGDMFGHVDTRSLHVERTKVLNEALKDLSKNKRVFATLGKEAGAIEAAGNMLAKGVNASLATQAGQTHALLEKLATTTGPVSSMLSEAAKDVAAGKPARTASRQFLSAISAAIKDKGTPYLMGLPQATGPTPAHPPVPAARPVASVEPPGLFDGPVKVREAVRFKGTPIPPRPANITPAAIRQSRGGKTAMAASVALMAVSAMHGFTAKPAQAAKGQPFDRTYVKGPKAGTTERVTRRA